ncbi:Universal stress protein PHOS32-like protein [Drosera capensis]
MPPKPNPSDHHHHRPPPPPVAIEVQPSSPRYPLTPTRKIAIAVDLSDESAFAVEWAVLNYLRPADSVTILHVRPTSILYGADWGSTHFSDDDTVNHQRHQRSIDLEEEENRKRRLEEEFDVLTEGKIREIARPLVEARVPFRVHIVKDHDMKERLCLEIERLGLSAVIMGSLGFGAAGKRSGKGRLGSVSDYCVHHCVFPVVVVRFPEREEGGDGEGGDGADGGDGDGGGLSSVVGEGDGGVSSPCATLKQGMIRENEKNDEIRMRQEYADLCLAQLCPAVLLWSISSAWCPFFCDLWFCVYNWRCGAATWLFVPL